MRERVLTVHGIWSRGKWQGEIARAFWPHFHCIPIKYKQYLWLGPLNLLLEPWVLVVMGLVLYALRFSAVVAHYRMVFILVFLVLAYMATYLRRTLAFNTFLKQAGPLARRPYQEKMHLIAHSLGTYLTGRALQERADFHLGRIVLVGCVLPWDFPWHDLPAVGIGPVYKYLEVRNELARRDIVVYLAWLASLVIRGLGRAGFGGFGGPVPPKHQVGRPEELCPSCPSPGVVIHNVMNRYLGHSSTFVGTGYAETYWLPFLWGIEPPEYYDFLDHCKLAAALTPAGTGKAAVPVPGHLRTKLPSVEVKLHNSVWRWTSGSFGDDAALAEAKVELRRKGWRWSGGSLGDYVAREVLKRWPYSPVPLQVSVGLAVHGAWQLVLQALEAQEANIEGQRNGQDPDPTAEMALLCLNPKVAVRRAVAELP